MNDIGPNDIELSGIGLIDVGPNCIGLNGIVLNGIRLIEIGPNDIGPFGIGPNDIGMCDTWPIYVFFVHQVLNKTLVKKNNQGCSIKNHSYGSFTRPISEADIALS
jgi:hypothetical protein